MAIQEQSIFHKQYEAERQAFEASRRARRVDVDRLPRAVRDVLGADFSCYETLPLEEARHLEASDHIRLFIETSRGWQAAPHLRLREPGQKVLALRRLPPPARTGGGAPQRRPVAPLPSMANSSSYRPEPSVSITRPVGPSLEFGKGRDFHKQLTHYTVGKGDTVESITRALTGRANPKAVLGYFDGRPLRRDRPLQPDTCLRVHTGTTLTVGGGAINADSVLFTWTGPTAGQQSVPAVNDGWEFDIPVQPGHYTFTVAAGESRHSKQVEVRRRGKPQASEVAVRVGVFFDGTGNNRENDIPKGTDTNIARLFELYNARVDDQATRSPIDTIDGLPLFTRKFYKEGVGTQANAKNDDLDMVTGAGGVSRIDAAVEDIKAFFDHFADREGPRTVDVFGFSRGAALARDFINRVNEKLSTRNVRVGFVGLFDTVSSFGLPGNDIDIHSDSPLLTPMLGGAIAATVAGAFNFNLGLESATKVVHLVARNEYRANFPLQSFCPGPGKMPPGNIEEIAVPGCHADVGGGYGPDVMTEYRRLARREIPYRTVGPVQQWQAGLLAKKTELEREAAERGARLVYERTLKNAVDEAIDIYWFVRERPIHPGLSNVYLHVMYKKAQELEVPLIDEETWQSLVHTEPRRLGIDENLKKLFASDLVTPRNESQILNHYAHRSDIDWTNADGLTDWLANRGGEPEEREIFYNEPGEAINPTEDTQKAISR